MSVLRRPKSPTLQERFPEKTNLKNYKNCTDADLDAPPNEETACFIFSSVKVLFDINPDELRELKKSVSKAYLPNDSKYEEHRIGYNKRFNFYPSIIVFPSSIDDIKTTIKFCSKKDLPMVIRSGGHCYEPASTIQFGCILDLRNYDQTCIDCEKQIATVQVGSTLGEALKVINSEGFVLPTGTCITNGVGGFSLGGGVGFYTRKFGLTIDSILELKMINYKGHILTVNAKENPDLFFALRGAGGNNFGVIIDITFKIYPFQPTIVFEFRFNLNDPSLQESTGQEGNNIVALCDFWQYWMNDMTDNFNSDITMSAPHLPVTLTGIYLGKNCDEKKCDCKKKKEKKNCKCEEKKCGCEEKKCGCEEKKCGCEEKKCGCEEKKCSCKEKKCSCKEKKCGCEEKKCGCKEKKCSCKEKKCGCKEKKCDPCEVKPYNPCVDNPCADGNYRDYDPYRKIPCYGEEKKCICEERRCDCEEKKHEKKKCDDEEKPDECLRRFKERFLEKVKPLFDFNPIDFEWNYAKTPLQVTEYFGRAGYARPFYQDTKHNIANDFLPKEYFSALVNACYNIDKRDSFTKINLTSFGGAMAKVPVTDTAFPHRTAKYWIFYSAVWGIPSEVEQVRNIAWVLKLALEVSIFFTQPLDQYINFLNYLLPRDTYLISYFGVNSERLKAIKEQYDPKNVFTFKQGIKPNKNVIELQ